MITQRLVLDGGYPDGVWACGGCGTHLHEGFLAHRDDCPDVRALAAILTGWDRAGQCRNCGRPRRRRRNGGWQGAFGWCHPCYRRWRDAGRPGTGPPPPMSPAERTARAAEAVREASRRRLADYAWSRAAGLTVAQAADDVGLSERTAAERYEPVWRQRIAA